VTGDCDVPLAAHDPSSGKGGIDQDDEMVTGLSVVATAIVLVSSDGT
jgi:hypothetical protein